LDKVLIDTSAWIEFFRKKEPYYGMVMELLDNDRICCVGLVLAELLQGAKSEKELNTLKDFLHVFDFLPDSVKAWQNAGELSYAMQRKGKAIGLSDCYICILAKSGEVSILTLDRHFLTLKEECGLRIYTKNTISKIT